MTQVEQMQDLNDNVQMFSTGTDTNTGGMKIPASETHVDSYRSLDPARASLEDYNRSMLYYTQRQMSAFVGDSDRSSGSSGRSSQSSGQSGHSNETIASGGTHNANGPPPSAPAGSKISERDMADDESATY